MFLKSFDFFNTFRNVLGMRNLGEILSERESIAQEMQVKLILILMVGLGGGLKVLLFPKYC